MMVIKIFVAVVLMVISILALNFVGALLGVACVKWAQKKDENILK